jgi:ribosomal protein S18 acetylase RimI-like enzyme
VTGTGGGDPRDALDANPYAFLRNLGRAEGVRLSVAASHAALSSDLPIPMANSVFDARFRHPAEVADAVSGLSARRPLWWLGPSTRPADTGRLLERCGLRRVETLALMTADLRDLPAPDPAVRGLRMQEVRTPDALRAWTQAHARARGHPAAVEAAWLSVLSSLGTGPAAPLQHYLGRSTDGREPLACASVLLDGRRAGLYSVGTVPAARGRGVGTAVTLFALADARARGFRSTVLGAEPGAVGLYRRLGFVDGGRLEVYGRAD